MPTWRERSIPTCVGLTPPARRRACCTLVHPHVRGAHTSTATLRLDLSGPSPRAWGSRRQRPGDAAPPRSIPTCVGLTGWSGPGSSPPRVHPHVRGAHIVAVNPCSSVVGPSPRAWGSPRSSTCAPGPCRSIPTCVGLTGWSGPGSSPPRVHPHVRGAHRKSPRASGSQSGPSPRAWGSRTPPGWLSRRGWSIPTCVGLTATGAVGNRSPAVHPHVRGAHYRLPGAVRVGRGPSPRAWGSRRCPQAGRGKPRSIPTCVGLTSGRPPVPGRFPVHPHVRGAHLAVDVDGEIVIGPSPRAWGSHGRLSRIAGPRRSIPTCVGLTPPAASDRCGGPVHPHVRGAHQRTTRYRGFPQGPSPRAWGSHRGLSGGSNPPLVHPHVRGAHCGPQHRRSAVPGPSPRAWGSQKLTCNFVERYLLVINLAGGFIIQITLDRFQWMRSLATDLSFLCVFKNGCCPLAGVGIHGLSSSR